jgi:hypothetical protein
MYEFEKKKIEKHFVILIKFKNAFFSLQFFENTRKYAVKQIKQITEI